MKQQDQKAQKNNGDDKAKGADESAALAEDSGAAMFLNKVLGAPADEAKKKKDEKAKPEDEDEAGKEGDESGNKDEGKAGDEAGGGDEAKPAAKRKPSKAAAAPVIDEEKLGKSIAAGMAEHLAGKEKPEKRVEKDEPDPEDGLSDKDKRRVAVLRHMETMDDFKGKYKGSADRYVAAKKEALAYKAQWEKENPGQEFDDEDEAHSAVLEAINAKADYDDDDFTEALADIRAEKKLKPKLNELDDKISDVDRKARHSENIGKVVSAAESAGDEFWKELSAEFDGVVSKEGKLNTKALEKLKETEPELHTIAVNAAIAMENVAAELYALSNDLKAFDPKNPTHVNINSFCLNREAAMKARPKDERMDANGRDFATSEEFGKMSKAERARHWTFGYNDLVFMATKALSKKAKADLKAEQEKIASWEKRRGISKSGDDEKGGKNDSEKPGAENDDDADEVDGKPNSPSSAATPKPASSRGKGGGEAKTPVERFLSKL